MGYYLNPAGIENFKKAEFLIQNHGATHISPPSSLSEIPTDKALVCVMDNGPFEAAGYVYSDRELRDFTLPHDKRPKTWLLAPKEWVEKESGYKS